MGGAEASFSSTQGEAPRVQAADGEDTAASRGLITRLVRLLSTLLRAHAAHAQREAASDRDRLVLGAILVAVSALLLEPHGPYSAAMSLVMSMLWLSQPSRPSSSNPMTASGRSPRCRLAIS